MLLKDIILHYKNLLISKMPGSLKLKNGLKINYAASLFKKCYSPKSFGNWKNSLQLSHFEVKTLSLF